MSESPWLLVLGGLPLVGILVIAVLPRGTDAAAAAARARAAKLVALGVSLAVLAGTIALAVSFSPGRTGFSFAASYPWIPALGIHFSVGVDGIALVLIALTAVLVPVVLLASWTDVAAGGGNVALFVSLVLALETLLFGVFSATDVFVFYVFFEAMLVPMYFIIGTFGGERRSYAAMKFLVYSLLGGLIMLAAVIALYVEAAHEGHPTFSFTTLEHLHLSLGVQEWLFLGFFIAFAIKAPLFPFHTWLPDAAAEAPTGGSVLLVGVLDKVGTFGFIRYCLPLFPAATKVLAPMVITLAVIGILYGALVAMAQRDLKRLVSYTSIAHFGFIALGIFALTTQAETGSVLYMVNHGLSTGALFLIIGFLIHRRRSRDMRDFGGVGKSAPWLAGVFLVVGLSSLALPGLNSFVSEFLVLVGTFTRYRVAAVLATLGIILAAIYILLMYQRTMQGPVTDEANAKVRDLSTLEAWVIAPVIALIVALGVYPLPLLRTINPAVTATLRGMHEHNPAHPLPVADPGRDGRR